MCFGGFDAPSAGEQALFDYEAQLQGVPPLGPVPVARSGYVGPVAVTTRGFSRGEDGAATYDDGELGFSARGAVETLAAAAGLGGAVTAVHALERGAELAQGFLDGDDGLDFDVAAAEAADFAADVDVDVDADAEGLPSVAADVVAAGTVLSTAKPRLPKANDAERVERRGGVMRPQPWFGPGRTAPRPTADGEERETAREEVLRRRLRALDEPSGAMGFARAQGKRAPRLLGE